MLANAGALAQRRLARGLRLNHPEAVALISSQMMERIRDGYDVYQLMLIGRQLLGKRQVNPPGADKPRPVPPRCCVDATSPLSTMLHALLRTTTSLDTDLSGMTSPSPRPNLLPSAAISSRWTVGALYQDRCSGGRGGRGLCAFVFIFLQSVLMRGTRIFAGARWG